MKCPKCEYLGFETGDRCRNCGYDFTLLSAGDAVPDVDLLRAADVPSAADVWLNEPETSMVGQAAEPSLPLFTPSTADDEPLIRMPAAPRPPLAVRRTPETPRLRSVAKAVRRTPEPSFEFADDPAPVAAAVATLTPPSPRSRSAASLPVASGAAPRLMAALIDNAILLTIDLTVVGPEAPLALGIVDEFRKSKLKIFGPTKGAARIEASKVISKEIMHSAKILTARAQSFRRG